MLGPSGGGKTTVLRMIAGLEMPTEGEFSFAAERVNDVSVQQRNIGFVFQNYALFKNMNVFKNIAFGLKIKKWKTADIKARVAELLKLFGLEGLEKRYPHQLSGGQRQRVAIARALAPKPSVLLLDEPFGAVDAKIRQELREWLVTSASRFERDDHFRHARSGRGHGGVQSHRHFLARHPGTDRHAARSLRTAGQRIRRPLHRRDERAGAEVHDGVARIGELQFAAPDRPDGSYALRESGSGLTRCKSPPTSTSVPLSAVLRRTFFPRRHAARWNWSCRRA